MPCNRPFASTVLTGESSLPSALVFFGRTERRSEVVFLENENENENENKVETGTQWISAHAAVYCLDVYCLHVYSFATVDRWRENSIDRTNRSFHVMRWYVSPQRPS
jgi:hypothetical protein